MGALRISLPAMILLVSAASGCGGFTYAVATTGLRVDSPRPVSHTKGAVLEAYTSEDRSRLSVKYALTKRPHVWLNVSSRDWQCMSLAKYLHSPVRIEGEERTRHEVMLDEWRLAKMLSTGPKWPLSSMRKLSAYRLSLKDPIKKGDHLGVWAGDSTSTQHPNEDMPTNKIYFVARDANRASPLVISFYLPRKRDRSFGGKVAQVLLPVAVLADIAIFPYWWVRAMGH